MMMMIQSFLEELLLERHSHFAAPLSIIFNKDKLPNEVFEAYMFNLSYDISSNHCGFVFDLDHDNSIVVSRKTTNKTCVIEFSEENMAKMSCYDVVASEVKFLQSKTIAWSREQGIVEMADFFLLCDQ